MTINRNHIKRIFLALSLPALTVASYAQHPAAGTFSVIPRLGVSLSSLSGMMIKTTDAVEHSPHFKPGVVAGVDFDYQFMPNLSVMVGVRYSQQGCKYDNTKTETTTLDGNHQVVSITGSGYSDWKTQLHLLTVPIILNGYIGPGLAIKTGVEIGFPLSGRMKYTETGYTTNDKGVTVYTKPEYFDCDLKPTLSSVSVAIPVGVSYEFSNVIIDARYNLGLTNLQGKLDVGGKVKSRVVEFTAAYRFKL